MLPFPLPVHRPLTEFLAHQKTTDEAIMPDASSSSSCPIQTNKDRGSRWTALWWRDSGEVLSASAGPQDAAESRSYIHSHWQWQSVMESLLMFNHRQELMQCFCQTAIHPLVTYLHLFLFILIYFSRSFNKYQYSDFCISCIVYITEHAQYSAFWMYCTCITCITCSIWPMIVYLSEY